MDLKQLEYMVAIAEEESVSKAAKQFYISQSALSQQMAKVEKQLGAPLFLRGKHSLTLTPVGQLYVDAAKRILTIRNEMLLNVNEHLANQKHIIRIATAPGRSTAMLSEIYPPFLELFPNCEFVLNECPTKEAEHLLIKGTVDFAFTMIPSSDMDQKHQFVAESLHYEPLLLVTGVNSPYRPSDYYFNSVFDCSSADLNAFREASFVLPARTTRIREYVNKFLSNNSFDPYTSFDTINTLNIFRSMSKSNICTILTSGFLPNLTDYTCFSLGSEYAMDYCICWSPTRVLRKTDETFIEFCREYIKKNWL